MLGKTVSPKMSTVFVFAVSSSRYNLGGRECEKRVENTFSLLASFFIFLLLFGQLCLRFVGEEKPEEGAGQMLNGFFTFRLIAPPTQPDRDSSGQLSTVIRVAFFRLFKY